MAYFDLNGTLNIFDQAQGISTDQVFIAGEDLPAYCLLTVVSGIDDRRKLVRAQSPNTLPAIAISTSRAAKGAPIIPKQIGMVVFPSGTLGIELVPGGVVYTDVTLGNFTQTPPVVAQPVGVALQSGIIWFNPDLVNDTSRASFITSGLETTLLPNSLQLSPGPNITFEIKGNQFIISGTDTTGVALCSDVPKIDSGVGLVGTAVTASHCDHVHPYPSLSNVTPTTADSPASAGTSSIASRSDHKHAGLTACGDIPMVDSGVGAPGTGAYAAGCGHIHPETGSTYLTTENNNDKHAQSRRLESDGRMDYANIDMFDTPPDQDAAVEGLFGVSSYLTIQDDPGNEFDSAIFRAKNDANRMDWPGINIWGYEETDRDVDAGVGGKTELRFSSYINIESGINPYASPYYPQYHVGSVIRFHECSSGIDGPGIHVDVRQSVERKDLDTPYDDSFYEVYAGGVVDVIISGIPLGDHTPLVDAGVGTPGTSSFAARDDHVHPASGGSVCDNIPLIDSGVGDAGVGAAASRCDHQHPYPDLSNATPEVDGGAGTAGVGSIASRFDHAHPVLDASILTSGLEIDKYPSSLQLAPGPNIEFVVQGNQFIISGLATGSGPSVTLCDNIPLVDSGLGDAGVGTSVSRCDHQHPAQDGTLVPIDTSNFDKKLTSVDNTTQKAFDTLDEHSHDERYLTSGTPLCDTYPLIDSGILGAVGVGVTVTRCDHRHPRWTPGGAFNLPVLTADPSTLNDGDYYFLTSGTSIFLKHYFSSVTRIMELTN